MRAKLFLFIGKYLKINQPAHPPIQQENKKKRKQIKKETYIQTNKQTNKPKKQNNKQTSIAYIVFHVCLPCMTANNMLQYSL